MIEIDKINQPPAPLADLQLSRSLGVNGTRLTATVAGAPVGFIEIDTNREDAGRISPTGRIADIGNLEVDDSHRSSGVAEWLLGRAADWLRLARIDRLLSYADADAQQDLDFHRAAGFVELTRTSRGWVRPTES